MRIISNTITINLYGIAVGMPIPIILAISMNECGSKRFTKTVQLVTYAPHFLSTVVIVGIIFQILDPRLGILNVIRKSIGLETVNYLARASYFKSIFIWTNIWQGAGYSAIIYLAALSSINPELYEAAIVDGASRLKRLWHIDIPGIMPTIIILLILSVGRMMSLGFEKIYLMQNDLNLYASEVISTYVYKVGLLRSNFSYSTAIGLFNSLINLLLLVSVNKLAKKIGDTSLW